MKIDDLISELVKDFHTLKQIVVKELQLAFGIDSSEPPSAPVPTSTSVSIPKPISTPVIQSKAATKPASDNRHLLPAGGTPEPSPQLVMISPKEALSAANTLRDIARTDTLPCIPKDEIRRSQLEAKAAEFVRSLG